MAQERVYSSTHSGAAFCAVFPYDCADNKQSYPQTSRRNSQRLATRAQREAGVMPSAPVKVSCSQGREVVKNGAEKHTIHSFVTAYRSPLHRGLHPEVISGGDQ